MKPEPKYDRNNPDNASLPRSLYVPKTDPRADLREMVESVFSDRFMIFLSLLLVPIILLPFIFQLSPNVLAFLEICDWVIVVLFVTEYITRLYVAENRWEHFKSPWHIVDLIIIILPFVQYLPVITISITGSPSLLLRLLRIPRAFAVGSRAIASRRTNHNIATRLDTAQPLMVIRQVSSDFKITENLSWDDLKAHLVDENRHEWLDLHYVSDEDISRLSHVLEIAEPHFKSSLMDEIYPHIDYVQKASFIFVQLGEVQYPETTSNYLTISRSGIIIICNGKKIITLSRHNIDLLEEVLNMAQQKKTADAFVVPVLYSILEHMLNDYRSILTEIELEVLKIANTPRAKLPRDFLERIYQLDKEVSRLVSNLVHFKDMLSIITSKNVPLEGFNKESEETFNVLQEGSGYLNETAHDLIDNLRSYIDLYINQTSFETNRIIKILAVITAISVIPSAVGGLLGTNMLDTPYGANLWELSFIVSISMAFVAYTFVKLGWLKT
jgi:Mg2+ and Co2+ transporter CorA